MEDSNIYYKDSAVKRKVIIYPDSRDVTFDGIREELAEHGRVRGANALGNGGWLLRMSSAGEADKVLAAARKGKVTIGGKKVSAQRPAQGQGFSTGSNRIPLGGASASESSPAPFRKNRDNKRQRACTVIVARISPPTKESVKKVTTAAKKVGDIKNIQGPLSPSEIAEEQISLSQIEGRKVSGEISADGIVLVEFGGVAQAFAAVKELHCKSVQGLSKPLWARQLGGEGAKIKYWRIIVRNLPFKVDAKQLKKHASLNNELFVWDVHIPKGADGRVRGFGFVGFICRSDAERAIKTLNGTKLGGRTIVLDWTVGKKEYQEGKSRGDDGVDKVDEGSQSKEDEEDEGEDEDKTEDEEDSKDSKEENVENTEDEAAMLQRIISSFQANPNDEGKAPAKSSRSPSSSSVGEKGGEKETKEEDEEAIGRTVFVSHIPLNAYKIDLERVMKKFGEIKSCRMVIDKKARKFSGKAFVEYSKASAAKKAAAAHTDAKAGKKERISVNGHLINVYLALNRNGIQDLSDMIKKKTNRPDKRNLYLADEGYIDPSSAAAEGMSEGDARARERSHKEKLEKLKNPNMYVSTTRLMIRNLPPEMKKGELRLLCVKAVKERATKARPKVVQAKILYSEKERGRKVLQSSGRGFVEFEDHEHSLTCLRAMNNNPNFFSTQKRPIVEFAIENSQIVAKLKKRKAEEAERASQKKAKSEK